MKHVSVNFIPPDRPGEPAGYIKLLRSTWLIQNAAHQNSVWSDAKTRLRVVLVGNTQSLPPQIMEFLQDRYDLTCESQLYEEISQQYPGITSRLGGQYSIFPFAFFRWILIDRLFCGDPVLCYDGDIVHNADLDDLSRAFQGLTRTATSTAFAAISDRRWFSIWAENLKHFDRSPGAFLASHLPALKYGLTQFLQSPEEYFAKFLIESGVLPNDELPEEFKYWVVPQPQNLPRLNNFVATKTHNQIQAPMKYNRVDGVDFINSKPVSFWHMQKPFMSQLSCLAIFREVAPHLDPGKIFPFNFYGQAPDQDYIYCSDPLCDPNEGLAVPAGMKNLALEFIRMEHSNLGVRPRENPFHPEFLYDYYFRHFDFSLLFNNARWPTAGRWCGTP
jgi:hypothetical protein